jgi:hypothetical protein
MKHVTSSTIEQTRQKQVKEQDVHIPKGLQMKPPIAKKPVKGLMENLKMIGSKTFNEQSKDQTASRGFET